MVNSAKNNDLFAITDETDAALTRAEETCAKLWDTVRETFKAGSPKACDAAYKAYRGAYAKMVRERDRHRQDLLRANQESDNYVSQ